MLIGDVMDELGAALGSIAGLRVFPYSASSVTPPAAVVGWPDTYEFDSTMARGSDHVVFPVYVLVGKVDARSARDTLSAFCDGAGAKSVKAVVESAEFTSCDSVRVESCEFGVVTVAGVEYLAATFNINITGTGS